MTRPLKTLLLSGLIAIVLTPGLATAEIKARNISNASTEEIAKALAFRGITVPGHADAGAPWADISNFTLKVTFEVGDARTFARDVYCDLKSKPCTFEIPSPIEGGDPVSFSFVHRDTLRREIIDDNLQPIGLDSLRGDGVGLIYNGGSKRENTVNAAKDSLLGLYVSVNNTYLRRPNPKFRILPAAPRANNKSWRWGLSYTHLREIGLTLENPHGSAAKGIAKVTVINGDPAPGLQDYLLPMHATSTLIGEMHRRGVRIASQAGSKARTVHPSRFIALLEWSEQLTNVETGQVLQSDPADRQRPIICDLTMTESCQVGYRAALGHFVSYTLKHPDAVEAEPRSGEPMVAVDYSFRKRTPWDRFFAMHGVEPSDKNVDKNADARLVTVDDLMTGGLQRSGSVDRGKTYKDIKWKFRLRIYRLLN